jgi:hypothetical protein
MISSSLGCSTAQPLTLQSAITIGAVVEARALPVKAALSARTGNTVLASRELLAAIKARLAELDHFWEKEQTKGDVEAFILDSVFTSLPTPPFTPAEKQVIAANVYAHVWQQAMNGEFARAA